MERRGDPAAVRVHQPAEWLDQTGQVGNVLHAVKGELGPRDAVRTRSEVSRGASGVLDLLVGGWSIDGVARMQTGEQLDFGNVRLVGMARGTCRRPSSSRRGRAAICSSCRTTSCRTRSARFAVSATTATDTARWARQRAATSRPPTVPTASRRHPASATAGCASVVVNVPDAGQLRPRHLEADSHRRAA